MFCRFLVIGVCSEENQCYFGFISTYVSIYTSTDNDRSWQLVVMVGGELLNCLSFTRQLIERHLIETIFRRTTLIETMLDRKTLDRPTLDRNDTFSKRQLIERHLIKCT